jgi:hypothetical protein
MPATLTVNFTPQTPAPANGYKVSYRPAGSAAAYTELTVSSSPVVLPNLTANAYEGTIEAVCASGSSSTPQPFSAVIPMVCGSTRTETYSGTLAYTFPQIPLTLTNAANGTPITIAYNVLSRPNKFTVKNITDNTVVSNTSWIGVASYSGPWGGSLSTTTTGNMTSFNYDNTKQYVLEIECGPANLASFEADQVSVTVNCGTTSTTTTTTSTTTTTTTAAPTTQYYALKRCADNVTLYYTTTPLSVSGQLVYDSSTVYYTYFPGSNIVSSSAPANFIGTVTISGGSCPYTLLNGTVNCATDPGSFVTTIAGGTPPYSFIAYGTSQSNAASAVTGASGTRYAFSSVGTTWANLSSTSGTWKNIPNGTYFVAVRDNAGNVFVQTTPVSVSC